MARAKYGGDKELLKIQSIQPHLWNTNEFFKAKKWSPVEQAFHMLKRKLKGTSPWNKHELKVVAIQAWQSTREGTQQLVMSMNHRINWQMSLHARICTDITYWCISIAATLLQHNIAVPQTLWCPEMGGTMYKDCCHFYMVKLLFYYYKSQIVEYRGKLINYRR